MNHAIDIVLDLHESPVRGHVPDLALDLRSFGERLGNDFPGIHHRLTQAERNLARFLLNVKDHRLDLVANLEYIAGAVDLLCPRHFRDVDEAFDALLKLHEATIGHDIDDSPLDTRTNGVLHIDRIPGIPLFLLDPQGNALAFPVNVQNHDLNLFTDLHHFTRVRDPPPRHIGDMEESIHALQVNKCTKVGDVLHHATTDFVGFESFQERLALFRSGFFQNLAPAQNNVAPAGVDLEDTEILLATNVVFEISHWPDINLGPRQERVHTHVDDQATLHTALDQAANRPAFLVVLDNAVPGLFHLGLADTDNRHAVFILDLFEEDIQNLPRLHFRPTRELFARDEPFGLVPDIEEHPAIPLFNHPALDDCSFSEGLVDALPQQLVHAGHVAQIDVQRRV